MWFSKKVKLPTTESEYETLVNRVVDKYKLTDRHHAAAIMSVAIRHIPNEEAYTTLDYLGQYIMKNIANYVAYHKGETLKHKSQIQQLESILTTDPNNSQAMDELTKAAKEGSQDAKDSLDRLLKTPAEPNVVSLKN